MSKRYKHRHEITKMVFIFLAVFIVALVVSAAELLIHLLPFIAVGVIAYLAGKHRERRAVRRGVRKIVRTIDAMESDGELTVMERRAVQSAVSKVRAAESLEDSDIWPGDVSYTERPETLTRDSSILNDPRSGVHDLYGRDQ